MLGPIRMRADPSSDAVQGISGRSYYRARYYDPAAGRFLSQDTIGFNGGVNPYAYVRNGSLNFADPLGLQKTCTPVGDPLQITPWMRWADGVHPKNLRKADFRSAVQRVGPGALRQKVSLNQASRPPEGADAFAGDDPAELSSFHLVVV